VSLDEGLEQTRCSNSLLYLLSFRPRRSPRRLNFMFFPLS
jgi:hypothetical protein